MSVIAYRMEHESHYLMTAVYPADSEYHQSDQISVAADVWESFHAGWESARPLFVRVGLGDTSAICRLRPSTETPYDSCQIPEWLWIQLGAPSPEDWISVCAESIPDAKRLVLRAYVESSLTDMEDPVATLTLALSGAGGLSWSCLNRGADLPLACGTFSIVDLLDDEERSVGAACILDVDLELDIVPACNATATASASASAVHTSTPIPSPPLSLPQTQTQTQVRSPYKNGFVPFSGVGRRLCD